MTLLSLIISCSFAIPVFFLTDFNVAHSVIGLPLYSQQSLLTLTESSSKSQPPPNPNKVSPRRQRNDMPVSAISGGRTATRTSEFDFQYGASY